MLYHRNLVFKAQEPALGIDLPEGIHLEFASEALVERLFDSRDQRSVIFNNYLQKGSVGIFLLSGDSWVFYGWVSLPGRAGPPHLPGKYISRLDCLWIHTCHTREEWRGRGLYKAGLAEILRWQQVNYHDKVVYIDTEPGNTPARKAICDNAFSPSGEWRTFIIKIPRIKWFVIGLWDKGGTHGE